MAFVKVAEGTDMGKLGLQVAEQSLQPGARVHSFLKLSVPIGWAFNVFGAERLFSAPDGLRIVDVHSNGSSGAIIEMEVEGNAQGMQQANMAILPLLPLLGIVVRFIAANWIAILIAGFVLRAVVTLMSVFADIEGVVDQIPWGWIVVGLVAVVVLSKVPLGKKGVP